MCFVVVLSVAYWCWSLYCTLSKTASVLIAQCHAIAESVKNIMPDFLPATIITLTSLCNLDPIRTHFYIQKLGISRVYNISAFHGLFCVYE